MTPTEGQTTTEAEVAAADALIEKCDKTLEANRLAPKYTESWCLLQLEIHRTRDLAIKRRDTAIAKATGAKTP